MSKLILPRSVAGEDPPHIKRLKKVGRWRLPDEGSAEWVDMRLRGAAAERDPHYRKFIKELGRVAYSTAVVVTKNGAGLPADLGIREFIVEYNSRNANFGLHYLPASFNVLEAFTDYSPKYALFLPLVERNYVCRISGFLDYAAKCEGDLEFNIEEGVVLNYSFLERPGDWVFGEDGSHSFVISSASIVRHQNEITLMCLAGFEEDLVSAGESLAKLTGDAISSPDKPGLECDASLVREAVPLDEGRKFRRAYFCTRYDADKKSIQVRYAMLDSGNTWVIHTDDPVTLRHLDSMSKFADAQKHVDAVKEYDEFFVFALRLLQLPNYFKSNAANVVVDKSVTDLAELGGLKGRRLLEDCLRKYVVYEREVSTLALDDDGMAGVVLPYFELKVEVDGYWQRLEFGMYGVGPDGERVLGKTWVNKTLSRRESVVGGGTVAVRGGIPMISGADEGYIYVLRNASHQEDVFKIGLTRRDVRTRSSEISRGTGVPDKFLTVQSWWVPDVVFAEKRIHQILDDYRLTERREFFRAQYSIIRAAVDLVVGEMAGRPISP